MSTLPCSWLSSGTFEDQRVRGIQGFTECLHGHFETLRRKCREAYVCTTLNSKCSGNQNTSNTPVHGLTSFKCFKQTLPKNIHTFRSGAMPWKAVILKKSAGEISHWVVFWLCVSTVCNTMCCGWSSLNASSIRLLNKDDVCVWIDAIQSAKLILDAGQGEHQGGAWRWWYFYRYW